MDDPVEDGLKAEDSGKTGKVKTGAKKVIGKGTSRHIVLTHNGRVQADLSLLVAALVAIGAPWLVVAAIIWVLLFDGDVSMKKMGLDDEVAEALTGA
jgi:hypothetical protein